MIYGKFALNFGFLLYDVEISKSLTLRLKTVLSIVEEIDTLESVLPEMVRNSKSHN